VNPVGKVEKLSVAVVIDNQTKVSTGEDGTQQTAQEPRNADEMKKYRDLVAAAIGFNADRGDQLTIENVSFAGETELVEKPAPALPFVPKFLEKQGPTIVIALRYLLAPIAFIIVYFLFLRPVQKTLLANLAPGKATAQISGRMPGAIQTPMTIKQLEAQLSGAGGQHGLTAADLQSLIPPIQNQTLGNLSPGQSPSKMEMIRQRVVEHAQSDPETVARLVRMWLSEERQK